MWLKDAQRNKYVGGRASCISALCIMGSWQPVNYAQSAEDIAARESTCFLPTGAGGAVAPQVGCRGAAAGGRGSLYLFEVRVSHHALQVVKDGVPLHGRQGLPGHVAGGLVLTLHLGGCRSERRSHRLGVGLDVV